MLDGIKTPDLRAGGWLWWLLRAGGGGSPPGPPGSQIPQSQEPGRHQIKHRLGGGSILVQGFLCCLMESETGSAWE